MIASMATLMALSEKSDNDIRACLNTLQVRQELTRAVEGCFSQIHIACSVRFVWHTVCVFIQHIHYIHVRVFCASYCLSSSTVTMET